MKDKEDKNTLVDSKVGAWRIIGEQYLQKKIREPKREKRASVMHLKWLWDDSADVSMMPWLWSSWEKL